MNSLRFWSKVKTPHPDVEPYGCWEWTGSKLKTGYAVFPMTDNGKKTARVVHRIAWEQFNGPVPDGLQLDHVCRNTICVRPDHLEPVTAQENVRRGTSPVAVNAAKKYCHAGHPLTPENLYRHGGKWGGRRCKTCHAIEIRGWRDRKLKTHKQVRIGARRVWVPREAT